jgi:hypothetical protein
MKHIQWSSAMVGSSWRFPVLDDRAIHAGVWLLILSVVVLFWSELVALLVAFLI